MSHRWQKVPYQLRSLAWRSSDAEIEQRPALEVIAKHNAGDCLIYADPPYPHDVRTQKMYGEEMTITEHEALETLLRHKGPVVVSGYEHPLYDEAFKAWDRVVTKAPKVEKAAVRNELLWVKPPTM